MLGPELLERMTARRAELDELEENPAVQLAKVRAERDELASPGSLPWTRSAWARWTTPPRSPPANSGTGEPG
ncbi:hypothetical protein [Streptomyces sp. KHY 26]|uniref:hypothetical protein n=1 Tax=Streptomyces sp. KHY 26 TaxID=3097359 RepID=UPI00376EF5EC